MNKIIEETSRFTNRNFCYRHSGFTVRTFLLTIEGKMYKEFNAIIKNYFKVGIL